MRRTRKNDLGHAPLEEMASVRSYLACRRTSCSWQTISVQT
ncbi:hypothetical protein PVAP13_4KG139615 [Panicum virgatum]|nr:hypothetical protein PVAP13_4KG139615 [Panicum virgatum]